MSTPTIEQQALAELRAVIEKYKLTAHADIGFYGENEGVDIAIGEKFIAHFDNNLQRWNFET